MGNFYFGVFSFGAVLARSFGSITGRMDQDGLGFGVDRTVLVFLLHISCIPSLGVYFSFGSILVFFFWLVLMVAPRFPFLLLLCLSLLLRPPSDTGLIWQ